MRRLKMTYCVLMIVAAHYVFVAVAVALCLLQTGQPRGKLRRTLSLLNSCMMRHWIGLIELAQGHLPLTSDGVLYHTSDNAGAYEILKTRTIRPGTNHEAVAYVSMSEVPLLGNVQIGSAADVCLGFHASAFAGQLDPVEYTERWYDENRERAAYVAGEGWYQQWQAPEDAYDEDGFEDEDVYNAAHQEAEFSAFMDKKDEREWISYQPGQAVMFKPDAVVVVITSDIDDWQQTLAHLGYHHVQVKSSIA